jgi:peptidyl-prolyl cis-trans isomerase-like 4
MKIHSVVEITVKGHFSTLLSLYYAQMFLNFSYFDNPLSLCRYDLVFDEDGAGYSDKKDHENGHRRKIQRNDDRRSELPPLGDCDRNNVRKLAVMRKEAGMIKMVIGTHGVGKLMTTDLVIEVLADMMIVIIASARTEAEMMRDNEDDYRRRDRSDGERHHRDDGFEKSDRRHRDEVEHRKRSPESRRREDRGHRERNQHSDDRSYKEKRHRD